MRAFMHSPFPSIMQSFIQSFPKFSIDSIVGFKSVHPFMFLLTPMDPAIHSFIHVITHSCASRQAKRGMHASGQLVLGCRHNGQRSILDALLGSLFQALGKIVTQFPIHHRLNKSKKSGSSERHKSLSMAAISHEGIFFRRQKFSSILSHRYFGRPMRLCPSGCQAITLFDPTMHT